MAVKAATEFYKFVNRFARKLAAKPSGEGIMQISNKQAAIDAANDILTKFKKHGVPNDMIRSENDVKVIYNQILNLEDQQLRRNVISPGDPRYNEITERILGKKKTTADLIDLGLVRKGKNVKKTTPKEAVDPKLAEEVKTQQTFDDFNTRQNQTDVVADTVTRVISMEPVAAMKEANKIIGRKGKYKNLTKEQSQKILKDTDDWIFQRDPDDLYDYNKKRPFRDDPDFDPEDLAYGGLAGMLGEPTYADGGRNGFKKGTKFDPTKRTFLKGIAALAALPVVGKFFKWAKPLAKTAKVADLTSVPINNVAGMPVWFKPLVNKVIKEGDDITKKGATGERQIVHTKKLDEFDEVTVTQDLDTGNVRVEYHGSGNMGEAPIQLDYKAAEEIPIEHYPKSPLRQGESKSIKTKDEFTAVEAEPRVVNYDGDMEWDGENVVSKIDDLMTDTTKLEAYATGKKPNIKKLLKSEQKQKKVNKLNEDQVEQAEYIEQKYGPGPDPSDLIDDVDNIKRASGGRVPMIFGGSAGLKALIARLRGGSKTLFPKIKKDRQELGRLVDPKTMESIESLNLQQLENMLEALKTDKKAIAQIAENKAMRDPGLDFLMGKMKEDKSFGLDFDQLAKYTDIDNDIMVVEQMIKNKTLKGRKPNATGGRVSLSAGGLAGMLGE